MTDAPDPQPPEAPPYHPAQDLQALVDIINELLPQDKPRTRALLAEAATYHAGQIKAGWPKA